MHEASRAIPLEIAFLAEAGFAPDLLRHAARVADEWGTGPEEALIALGICSEMAFIQALGAHLNLATLSLEARARGRVRVKDAIATGICPVEDAGGDIRYAIAPRGKMLRGLVGADGRRLGSIALTTAARLRRLARESMPAQVAHAAANALPDATPERSARDGLFPLQVAVFALIVGLICFIVTISPLGGIALLLGLVSVPFFGLVLLRLTATFENHPVEAAGAGAFLLEDSELPTYTVLVPLYREVRILPQLINAMCALDYPPARLDVKILVEEHDILTREALAASALPCFIDVVVAPKGEPRTKPRALNVGLAEAMGEYLVVYDAEDVPHPLQLRHAACRFHRAPKRLACLQARLVIDNTDDNWLTRLFTIEYAQLFDVLNPTLAAAGLPIPLGGTSNHFRMDVLRKIGGWDAWNVTEDADLGIRLAALGYDVGDLPSSTHEEAPARLSAWFAQRTRWFKGWVQVLITFSRRPIRLMAALGSYRFCAAVALMLGTVLTAIGFPFFLAAALWLISGGRAADNLGEFGIYWVVAIAFAMFATGFASMILPAMEGLRRRRLARSFWFLLLLPFYYMLMSAAAWRAVWELIRAPARWNKTEHGLARTSRTGALAIRGRHRRS